MRVSGLGLMGAVLGFAATAIGTLIVFAIVRTLDLLTSIGAVALMWCLLYGGSGLLAAVLLKRFGTALALGYLTGVALVALCVDLLNYGLAEMFSSSGSSAFFPDLRLQAPSLLIFLIAWAALAPDESERPRA